MEMSVLSVRIISADQKCRHTIMKNAGQWADDVRLSDIEERFNCSACGKRAAVVRPWPAQQIWDDWRSAVGD